MCMLILSQWRDLRIGVICDIPHFVRKDYHHTISVTGLLDELSWLPLFEHRKHSRLTAFYKALNNL